MNSAWEFISRIWKKVSADWAPYLEETVAAEELLPAMVRVSIP
jgi:hypothetical protein